MFCYGDQLETRSLLTKSERLEFRTLNQIVCCARFVIKQVNPQSIFLFPVRYWFLFGIDKITSWWDVDIPINCSITNMINWSNNLKIDVETKRNCDAVVMVTFWSIWSYRNKMVFDLVKPRKDMIFDDIRSFAYFWVKNRRRNCKFDQNYWLFDPKLVMSSL